MYPIAQQYQLFTNEPDQHFGGTWTSTKLEKIERYLKAFVQVMKKQSHLRTIYIDAFAGSGLVSLRDKKVGGQLIFPEFADELAERFLEGSTRAALKVDPSFDYYYFVEKNREWAQQLEELKSEFSERAALVKVLKGDANDQVVELCKKINWKYHRAVLFLDPYGMQVKWSTLQAIAKTRAIDMWYLFPLGVGVNRLLKNDGRLSPLHQLKLDDLFGTPDWQKCFYSASTQRGLFEESTEVIKVADLK